MGASLYRAQPYHDPVVHGASNVLRDCTTFTHSRKLTRDDTNRGVFDWLR